MDDLGHELRSNVSPDCKWYAPLWCSAELASSEQRLDGYNSCLFAYGQTGGADGHAETTRSQAYTCRR